MPSPSLWALCEGRAGTGRCLHFRPATKWRQHVAVDVSPQNWLALKIKATKWRHTRSGQVFDTGVFGDCALTWSANETKR